MIEWLRRAIKAWLLKEDKPPPSAIDVIIRGRVRKMIVANAIGAKLVVYDGTDTELVSKANAVDPATFDAAWKEATKARGQLTWEDGTPFEGDL